MLQVVWLGAALQQIIEPESDVKWLMIRQGQEQQRAWAVYGDYVLFKRAAAYVYIHIATCSKMSSTPQKHLICSFFKTIIIIIF